MYDTWHLAASESIREEQVEEYQKVRFRHTRARQHFEEMKEQVDFYLFLSKIVITYPVHRQKLISCVVRVSLLALQQVSMQWVNSRSPK